MKRSSARLIAVSFLLALPGAAYSAEVSVDATSMVRFEQRDYGYKKDYSPATQFIGVDANKLADGNLSLHLYGWGRGEMRDKSYNSDVAAGSLTYAYLRYRFNHANADIRAGRFFVHEGIVNEHVDGVSARTDLPFGFGVSAFGGAPVHTQKLYNENSDGKGDGIAGGRLNYRYKGILELGASGVYEGTPPVLTNYAYSGHRLLGGDAWFSPIKQFEIMGHTSYNPEADRVAEHTYLLNVKPLKHLVLTGEFNEHREQSFLYSWAMFSKSRLNPNELSRSIGGSISYEFAKSFEVAADYKHYTRNKVNSDTEGGGNADRFGGEAKFSFLDHSARAGLAYHYLRASDGFAIKGTPSASYHEVRGYAMHDTKSYFAAVDAIGYIFNKDIYNEGSAWETMLSLGYHITPNLALSGDISYGRNPQFTEELKGLVRLTYNMTLDCKGGKK
jgi:hypothetical protein